MNNPVSSSPNSRRSFAAFVVVAILLCLAWSNLAPARPPASTSPDAVTLQTRDDVELHAIAPIDGFVTLVNQPGLILLFHSYTGTCYLAPVQTTPFVEVDPEVCATVRKRQGDRGRS